MNRADSYMLAVVLYAIALFFAALSTRLKSRDLRVGILTFGYLLFACATIWLATQPVHLSA